MKHKNLSQASLENNYYDINIGRDTSGNAPATKKKYPGVYAPRRVGSHSSLTTMSGEPKRPSDYYIQKLSNSSLNLSTPWNSRPPSIAQNQAGGSNRPMSGDSTYSLQSNLSDETSSVGSYQFDTPDTRLSSMTSNSIISSSESPLINNHSFISTSTERIEAKHNEDTKLGDIEEADTSLEAMSSSLSTITLKNSTRKNESSSDLTYATPSHKARIRPPIKSQSTSHIVHSANRRVMSTGSVSNTSLTRTKSNFMSAKQVKERQQLRKKLYDDNDDDDEILNNDLDLVFNVPVIQNLEEIYKNTEKTTSFVSRDVLLASGDEPKYKVNVNMKPCPLPGKLNVKDTSTEESFSTHSFSSDKHVEKDDSSISVTNDDDSEIINNISTYYNQKSKSIAEFGQSNREKGPTRTGPYSRSQSFKSVALPTLPERNADQTRPNNLPPKSPVDSQKHNKEFKKVLIDYEMSSKQSNETLLKSTEGLLQNVGNWYKMFDGVKTGYDLQRNINSNKNFYRKLCFDSICPSDLQYKFFVSILHLNTSEETTKSIRKSFDTSAIKFKQLNDSVKVIKDASFNELIDAVLNRPLFNSALKWIQESDSSFKFSQLHDKFKQLLYLKSLTEGGLRKHEEILTIPLLLLLFYKNQTLQEIYYLNELLNVCVFEPEFVEAINNNLNKWSSPNGSYKISYDLYKFIHKFENSDEFDGLNLNLFFEIILQLNDRSPMGLSAPTTPVNKQPGKFLLHNSSPSAEIKNEGDGQDKRDSNVIFSNSSSLNLLTNLFQLLVIYSNSPKTKQKNNLKILQSFLMVVFKFYHIDWNNYSELLKNNKSIKLNNSADQIRNLHLFINKWKDAFKNF